MKPQIRKTLGLVFVFAIIALFLKALYSNWNSLQSYEFEINITSYILSTIIILFVIFTWGALWNLILRDFGFNKLSFHQSFKIHVYSWFGKYVPGKVGLVGTKYYLGKQKGIDKSALIFSTIYENIFQILSAFLVSVPILFYCFLKELDANPLLYKILPVLFIFSMLLLIHPDVFFFFINYGLKLMKRNPIEKKFFLSETKVAKYIILYSFCCIANGIAFFIFINAITSMPFSIDYLIAVIGIFNFAGVIGLLAIFVPAGLGVREGIIVIFLSAYISFEIAILISILSRLWLTIADVVLGLYVISNKIHEKSKRKSSVE